MLGAIVYQNGSKGVTQIFRKAYTVHVIPDVVCFVVSIVMRVMVIEVADAMPVKVICLGNGILVLPEVVG